MSLWRQLLQHTPANRHGGKKLLGKAELPRALDLSAWEREIPLGDKDHNFILLGVKEGFRITNRTVGPDEVYVDNYQSAMDRTSRDLVEKQILEEIANGRYIVCREPRKIVSALGAIPKPEPGKIRLIHNCSRPLGSAVNDYASYEGRIL